ncbi:MAG: DUF2950 family protein [Planctomycetes bacterium]|nr:DUF2950 family protein [Planctomycetota bacterium]
MDAQTQPPRESLTLVKSGMRFSTIDLLYFVSLCGFGLFLVTPLLQLPRLQGEWPDLLAAGLVMAAALAGGLAGLFHAAVRTRIEFDRGWLVLGYVVLAWGILILTRWIGASVLGVCLLYLAPGAGLGIALAKRERRNGWDCARYGLAGAVSGSVILGVGLAVIHDCGYVRRTSGNECAAISQCKTYCEAQDIYRRTDYDGDGLLEYAQQVTGKHSLKEANDDSCGFALVDGGFARATLGLIPKAGYFFKVLHRQGSQAPGGARSYLTAGSNGDINQTLGYALVAWPAKYGETGVHTLAVNSTGTVYQKDLGPNTANLVATMTEFNPDSTWVISE